MEEWLVNPLDGEIEVQDVDEDMKDQALICHDDGKEVGEVPFREVDHGVHIAVVRCRG